MSAPLNEATHTWRQLNGFHGKTIPGEHFLSLFTKPYKSVDLSKKYTTHETGFVYSVLPFLMANTCFVGHHMFCNHMFCGLSHADDFWVITCFVITFCGLSHADDLWVITCFVITCFVGYHMPMICGLSHVL